MRYTISLLIILCSLSSFAQDDNALPERKAFRLSLPVDKSSVYEADIEASPFIRNKNILQLYPGETAFVELEQVNGETILRSVKAIKDSSKTLTVSFTQSVNKGKHELMMLKVENPFKKNLAYNARIFVMAQNKWASTDVLPVMAGLTGFETWPYVIVTIGLSGWKFVE